MLLRHAFLCRPNRGFAAANEVATSPQSWRRQVARPICLALTACLASILGGPVSASPSVEGFTFGNLGNLARLVPRGDAWELQDEGLALHVRMADRLLVKADEALDAPTLEKLAPQIGKVQKLARLRAANLWLLTVAEGSVPVVLQVLQREPGVLHAQPDLLHMRQPAALSPPDVLLPEILPMAVSPPGSGAARVAIIDDGFDLSHPEFSGVNLLFQYDADQQRTDAGPKQAADHHGTQVAGLIVAAADGNGVDGLAPEAGLIAIRQVSSWTSDMVLAFSVARMMQADIVNASWTLAWMPEPLFDLIDDWLHDPRPPYVVVAAGNRHEDACTGNALSRIPGVWLVGAHLADGRPAPWSNHGSCVALSAPARFTSTVPGQGYARFSGTSASAAWVSGLLAQALGKGERPDLNAMRALLQPAPVVEPSR